jgi:basic membrane protein A
MSKTSRALLVLVVLAMSLLGSSCGGGLEQEDEVVKVALLLNSPVADSGWNATAYQGLQEAEEDFGIEGVMVESIATPELEAVMRDYAEQGYDLIIGHSFPFGEPAMAIAAEYPDTFFVVTNGYVEAENVATFAPMEVEPCFLAGVLAASMTTSKNVGTVIGERLPNLIAQEHALVMGAEYVDPAVDVGVSYVGSWGDPVKGKEQAMAFLQEGADLLIDIGSTTGLGTLEAAEENGIPVISYSALGWEDAPDEMIAAFLPNFRAIIKREIELYINDELEGKTYRPDLASGLIDLYMKDTVPSEAQDAVETARQAIIDGELEVQEIFE